MIEFCLANKEHLVAKALGFNFHPHTLPNCPLQVGDIICPTPNSPVVYRVALRTYFPPEESASSGRWQVLLEAMPHAVPPPDEASDRQTQNPALP